MGMTAMMMRMMRMITFFSKRATGDSNVPLPPANTALKQGNSSWELSVFMIYLKVSNPIGTLQALLSRSCISNTSREGSRGAFTVPSRSSIPHSSPGQTKFTNHTSKHLKKQFFSKHFAQFPTRPCGSASAFALSALSALVQQLNLRITSYSTQMLHVWLYIYLPTFSLIFRNVKM